MSTFDDARRPPLNACAHGFLSGPACGKRAAWISQRTSPPFGRLRWCDEHRRSDDLPYEAGPG